MVSCRLLVCGSYSLTFASIVDLNRLNHLPAELEKSTISGYRSRVCELNPGNTHRYAEERCCWCVRCAS